MSESLKMVYNNQESDVLNLIESFHFQGANE